MSFSFTAGEQCCRVVSCRVVFVKVKLKEKIKNTNESWSAAVVKTHSVRVRVHVHEQDVIQRTFKYAKRVANNCIATA